MAEIFSSFKRNFAALYKLFETLKARILNARSFNDIPPHPRLVLLVGSCLAVLSQAGFLEFV